MSREPHTSALRIPGLETAGKAVFLERLNRFVVDCELAGKRVKAYLPNPGRLWELLLPGRTLHLARMTAPGSRMRYTVLAVEREGRPVLLHTHLTNRVAEELVSRGRIPGLEDARILKREVAAGRSRFDFLLERRGGPFLLEVKSCTLSGKRIAMFPDAVTERGKRHLLELAGQSRSGTPAGVLFVVSAPGARYFLPDYHTDPEFSRTLYDLREDLLVKAVAVNWERDLGLSPEVRDLEIPWGLLDREAADRGSYILILHLPRSGSMAVGRLGNVYFRRGYYLYAGSARRALKARMARHLRKRKNVFWHVDYLARHCDSAMVLPVRSSSDLEHEIAGALGTVSEWSVPGFGSSDCNCETHLFGMRTPPLQEPHFIETLLHFRIDRLERALSPQV